MSDYKRPKRLRPVHNNPDRLRSPMKPGTKFSFVHHCFLKVNTILTSTEGIQQIVVECINKCNILSCVWVSLTPECDSLKEEQVILILPLTGTLPGLHMLDTNQ